MSDFLKAAHYTDRKNPLPHQDAAWHFAWRCLDPEEQAEFLDLFRAAIPSKTEPLENNWAGILEGARNASAKYPELVAAQWALESGWGKHFSGKWNPFGLKAASGGTPCPTTEVVAGMTVHEVAYFQDFKDLQEAIDFLVSRWYKDFDGHSGVERGADREEAARLLTKEGYATDPNYSRKLIDLMNQHAARPQPTAKTVQQEVGTWRTKVNALNLSQPDARTCQATCIAMAVGDRDIVGIRALLSSKGVPGNPETMKQVIETYNVAYQYESNASLDKCVAWLKAGELLITHGWFTKSGHVIVLDGVQERPDGSIGFDVKDPWSEFDAPSWSYNKSSKFFDGYYSDRAIFAACVASHSCVHAASIYKRNPVLGEMSGMWVHRFMAPSA